MKIKFLILFCLVSSLCLGQDFSEKWKADSLGENGFRKKSVAWDTIKKVYLINKINFNGQTKMQLISTLGNPNSYSTFQYSHGVGLFKSHTHPIRQTMIYYLNGKNSLLKEDDYLTFIIHKNKVYNFDKHYLDKFEKHKFLGHLLSN